MHSAARAVREHITPGALVILESTTYIPGRPSSLRALVIAEGLTVGVNVRIAFRRGESTLAKTRFAAKNTLKVVAL